MHDVTLIDSSLPLANWSQPSSPHTLIFVWHSVHGHCLEHLFSLLLKSVVQWNAFENFQSTLSLNESHFYFK